MQKIFQEKRSAGAGKRPQLEACLKYVREEDTLVVTRLARLARSTLHLCQIADELKRKGVELRVVDQNIDTADATGRLLFNMLGAIAQFERKMMLERQREGIAKAKAEGRYKGRKPTARAKANEIKALSAQGVSLSEIARRLNVGKASVHRVLRADVLVATGSIGP